MLTETKWQVVSLIYQQLGLPGASQMISVKYKSCELDDIYEFKKDSSFVRSDGVVSCSPGQLLFGPYGGIWTADAAYKKITVDVAGFYHASFDVRILDTDLLEWEQVSTDYLGNTISYTYLFKGVH